MQLAQTFATTTLFMTIVVIWDVGALRVLLLRYAKGKVKKYTDLLEFHKKSASSFVEWSKSRAYVYQEKSWACVQCVKHTEKGDKCRDEVKYWLAVVSNLESGKWKALGQA